MNNLDNLNNYFLPSTLDGINIVTQSISTDALLVDGTNMMLADIDMNFHVLKNLDPGIAGDESVNVNQLNAKANILYVDTADNLRVLKSGDTMTGNLAMSNNKITNLNNGANANDAVNKSQLDLRALDTAVVHNTGDETVAGTKSFSSRTVISPNSGQSASAHLELNNGSLVWMRMFTNLSGGNYNSAVSAGDCAIITNQNNPLNNPPTGVLFIGPHDGAGESGFKIAPTQNTSYKPLSLNTSNKIINMAAGTNPNDAVNKGQLDLKADISYVNSQDALKVSKSGDTMTGILSMSNNKITNLADGANVKDAVNYQQLSLKAPTTYVDSQDNLRLLKAGDTMTGGLAMSFNKITNLNNGANANDAVNKSQLDLKADITFVNTLDAQNVKLTGNQTISGVKTFSSSPIIPNATGATEPTAYGQTTTLDAQNVKLTGNQTISGVKTFSSSPIIPNAIASAEPTAYGQTTTLDAQNVKLTGTQTIAGSKTFSNGITINSASPQITITNGGSNSFSWTQGTGGTVTQNCAGNMILNSTAGSTFIQSAGVSKLEIISTGASVKGSLDMNTSNKIVNLANGTATSDAVNKGQLDLKLNLTGGTLTGALSMNTTNKITNLANGTATTDAVNKGQMDNEFSSRERTRIQTTACQLWRKVSGTDTSIWARGVGWSIDAHSDPIAASGSTGLTYTAVDKGVFLRTHVTLYKGDVVDGFFYSCETGNSGSTVKMFIYDWTDNLVATTDVSTCPAKLVCFCPFSTSWTVPSTQTYKVCLVYQTGTSTSVLTCASIWVANFNTMACAYNNTYIGQSNKSPPSFYDLTDTTLGRIAMIFAYTTI